MFSNQLSKQNLPAILTTILLVLTTGALFWYGNFKINKAGDVNSTIVAWENLRNTPRDLSLNINNATNQEKIYQIKWLLNKKVIDTNEIKLPPKTIKTISPTKKVLTNLAELSNNNQEILYQARISWDQTETETLGKWIVDTISN